METLQACQMIGLVQIKYWCTHHVNSGIFTVISLMEFNCCEILQKYLFCMYVGTSPLQLMFLSYSCCWNYRCFSWHKICFIMIFLICRIILIFPLGISFTKYVFIYCLVLILLKNYGIIYWCSDLSITL